MEKELTTDVKNILGLQLPTDPRWVNLAEMQLEEIKPFVAKAAGQ